VKGEGAIVVADDGGRLVLRSTWSEPPFSMRRCGDRILIAASAAAPVGGDELCLAIEVLPGARADIGTVAATIVLPGPTGAPSTMTTECIVGAGAHLDWTGEPTVSVAGSDHTITTTVRLAETATCRIVEEVSLGRSHEPSGRLRLVLRVERDGQPLAHHDELFGPDVPGARSVVSVGDARHVYSAVIVGIDAGASRVVAAGTARAAWLPIAPDATFVLGVGPDRPATLDAVEMLTRDGVSS
jgi:urease accessory protein